jgi:hypothetical protein
VLNTVVSTTFSNEEDDMETLRSADELSMEKQDCLSAELNFKNSGSHIELVMDEDLDSSLTNDGKLVDILDSCSCKPRLGLKIQILDKLDLLID